VSTLSNCHRAETATASRSFRVWPRVQALPSSSGGELGSAGEGANRSSWAFRVGGAVLFVATATAFGSALDDLVLYFKCESSAMDVIKNHARLKEVLGEAITPRAWWNASVSKSDDGQSVMASLTVDGSKASSDIYYRAVRHPGSSHTLIYNLFGDAKWEVMFLDAMLPDKVAGSRLPVRVDLLAVEGGNIKPPQPPQAAPKEQA